MSRHRRTGLIVAGLLATMLAVWFDHSQLGRRWWRQAESRQPARSDDLEKYHAKTFTVINVVDGDTLDIDIADGKYDHTRIRLWGIDTPETKNPETGVMYFGPEASEFTKELALGKPVTVYLDKTRTRDNKKYNRLLAYVKLPDGGFLNEVLLTEGFAYSDLRFKHNLYNKYKQLEAAARSQKKGLWLGVTPEQWPEWRQQKSKIKV
jgi:micrococcal nuclease